MPSCCKELEDPDPAGEDPALTRHSPRVLPDCERPCLHSHVIEECLGPGRLACEKHEDIVIAVEELARFEDTSAEQADKGGAGKGRGHGKAPPHLNGVDVEPCPHVLLYHRQLLNRVIDTDRSFGGDQGRREA